MTRIDQMRTFVRKGLRDNSTTILTAMGVSGTIGTAYLTAKASFQAAKMIDHAYASTDEPSFKDKARLTWKLYIPAAVSGSVTIACIIGGTRMGTKKTAAAYSLLTLSEKGFVEYKDKVVEQIGEKKEKELRDEIAQDRVNANAAPSVIIFGGGKSLCYEMHTGRYFHSDMEKIRTAVNDINAKLLHHGEATLFDLYYMLDLPATRDCGTNGWTSDKLLKIDYSAVLCEDEGYAKQPCMVIDYNYIKPL